MTLHRLSIKNLRNLDSVDISPSEGVNLFFGENGSGKTSILEAISVLGLGRSFRSHKHKSLITHQQQAFTVFGRIESEGADVPVGISRQLNGESSFKANGALISSAASLAGYLPLQIINSDTFLLLEGSPKVRRQFIDWLVFHVEPAFFQTWKDTQRCLKHRNSLLRHDRIDRFEIATWDQELVQLTERMHSFREACMERFCETFFQLLEEFIAVEGIDISYFCGWDKTIPYGEILVQGLDRDRRQGYTQIGSHRADLRITVQGQNAADVLSRGQQKLLVCALKIAQGYVFCQITGRKCIYLVDDLPAELDAHYRSLLAKWLDAMDTQIFVTGVERDTLVKTWSDKLEINMKLFHVEQGRVTAVAE